MLINEDYKFAFIHIPKNAGTTVRSILNPLDNEQCGGNHITLPQMIEVYNEYEGVRPDYFYSFAFVRNPWERALSLFSYYKAEKHPHILLPKGLEFNEWAVNQFDTTNPDQGSILRNSMKIYRNEKEARKFTEEPFDQCHWIPDDINYIGRVETFVDDMINIGNELDIIGRRDKGKMDIREIRTTRTNVTEHKPYHEVYSKEARDVVTNFFQRDIERFEYEFLKL